MVSEGELARLIADRGGTVGWTPARRLGARLSGLLTGDALAPAAQLLNTGWLWTPSLFVHYASVLWLVTGAALCFRWVVKAAWSGEG